MRTINSNLTAKRRNGERETRRPGFTLVEMIVVLTIMLILTVIAVAVAPRFQENQRVVKAADLISQWLLTAKTIAQRDQVPTGVRLNPDPLHSNLITELQLIQQPDDFKGGVITFGQVSLSTTSPPVYVAVGGSLPGQPPQPPVDFTGGLSNQSLWSVLPGDFLEVKGSGLVHQIQLVIPPSPNPPFPSMLVLAPVAPSQVAQVNGTTVQMTNVNQLAVGMIVQGQGVSPNTTITAINNTTYPPSITLSQPAANGPSQLTFLPGYMPSATFEYRVIRQPRVLVGETPLQLPTGTCIDPAPKFLAPPPGDSNGFVPPQDILFSPQGGVVNVRGSDRIVLWVRDYTKDLSPQALSGQPANTYPVPSWPPAVSPGEEFLVFIQVRTGFIAVHPVDVGSADPYRFTKDARSSGL